MMPGGPTSALQQLIAQLGTDVIVTDPEVLAGVSVDHRKLYEGRALALALPRDTAQVSRLLSLCNALRIPVVPQGGNTGYCAAATPDDSATQLVVSLRRMNAIREVQPANDSITVEAGCILADVQRRAADAGRFFPLSLGAQGSCHIGGNLSTNAGGVNVLRYGMMRDLVLGLEVVLADGRVLSSLAGLRKDNTGYDLRHLFIGAEGTLGIITAATLKLFPASRAVATALVALPNPAAAVTLLGQLRRGCGDLVSSFELIPRVGDRSRRPPPAGQSSAAREQLTVVCTVRNHERDGERAADGATRSGAVGSARIRSRDRCRHRTERTRATGFLVHS